MPPCIQQTQTAATDIGDIVAHLKNRISPSGLSLLLIFFFPRPDADALAEALTTAFAPVPVVGCSTIGEIGPLGYSRDSLVAIGLHEPDFAVSSLLIDRLSQRAAEETHQALRRLLDNRPGLPGGHGQPFAITLFDGFCRREEHVSSAIHAVLGNIPVCGGSAGDGRAFQRSHILYDGRLHQDCLLLLLVQTTRPFQVFKTEHFLPREERLVVTGANAAQRVVTEINGRPAAQEYARLIGVERARLDMVQFARHPLLVRVGRTNFIRSIIQCHDDDSLTFACAIDVGMVLHLGSGQNMAADLERQFEELRRQMGDLSFVLGFDCFLRRFEMEDRGETATIAAIMKAHHVAGFSTQGEHFQGMHINQTFTGVAIGGQEDTTGETAGKA